jgi:hypothetical protein
MSKEDWMHPGKVLLASIIISVVVGLILYYTSSSFLTTSTPGDSNSKGLFTASNWITTGGGAPFMLLVAILIALSGASIGMSWKNNGSATIWSMGASGFVGFIYFFVFDAAKNEKKDQFVLWSIAATIAAIGVSVYGWWRTKKNAKDEATSKPADREQATKRSTWATGFLAGTVIIALVVASGLWKIHSALSNAIQQ